MATDFCTEPPPTAEAEKIGKEEAETKIIAQQAQTDLDKAIPALNAAADALNALNKAHIRCACMQRAANQPYVDQRDLLTRTGARQRDEKFPQTAACSGDGDGGGAHPAQGTVDNVGRGQAPPL